MELGERLDALGAAARPAPPEEHDEPRRAAPQIAHELGAQPLDHRGAEVVEERKVVEKPRGLHRPEPEQRVHARSEEHTSELQSPCNLVCRLLLEKKKEKK